MIPTAGEFAPWNGVFETLRVIDGVPIFMKEHRLELGRAMTALGLESNLNLEEARTKLPQSSGRWRWIVTPAGTTTHFIEEEIVQSGPIELSVSPVRVGSCNWDARFKTLSYLTHAQAWKIKTTDEAVLLNEHGHLASVSRANLFWRLNGQLYTPDHETGCRCGVLSAFVCKQRQVTSGHFSPADLLEADEIFITNSLRGIVSVRAFEGRSFDKFATADQLREEYASEVAAQVAAGKVRAIL